MFNKEEKLWENICFFEVKKSVDIKTEEVNYNSQGAFH